jgi:hypothetical protein
MPRFEIPTSIDLHSFRHLLSKNNFFEGGSATEAVVEFEPRWMHLEPVGLAMLAAWGVWCRRQGLQVQCKNLGQRANYAARMKLFEHLGVDFQTSQNEREEAGRFMPLRQVRTQSELNGVIGDLSALLHLDRQQDALAASQYCLSELLRNVIEHAHAPDGAFVCAHNFSGRGIHRVTIAVADCGVGIRQHLGTRYPNIANSDKFALQWAMKPGITGASSGLYGAPDNAGAGLFITRSIAKGTGGYFALLSGDTAYRQRRLRPSDERQQSLFPANAQELSSDPFQERHDLWVNSSAWKGTVVSMEIRTENVAQFSEYFTWIRSKIPARSSVSSRLRVTWSQ